MAKAAEFIAVYFLHRAPAALGAERQDMVEVGLALQRAFQAHGTAGRDEIHKRTLARVPAVRSRTRDPYDSLPIHFVTKENVAAFDLIAQVAKARGAANPSFIAHSVNAS